MINYFFEFNRYLNIVGIVIIALIAFVVSQNRRAIQWRVVLSALGLHILCGLVMLRTSIGYLILSKIAQGAQMLSVFADKGIEFMFGKLGDVTLSWGFIFAFKVLPIIIFVGALTAILFHWGIIQKIVAGLNMIIRPILGTSGIETVSAIANSILGQTEAALFVSNYLHVMTRSELFVLMTSGMAAISISVLVIYTMLGIPAVHLLTASLLSIPASIFIAKIIVPETEKTIAGNERIRFEKKTTNIFDAISKGTFDGLKLAVGVAAMLISFLALIALGDYILASISHLLNNIGIAIPELSFALILSYIFAPFAFLLGLTGDELWQAGQLLGIKVSINELVAFTHLVQATLSPRSFIILVYALCGFSNFSCIGIQIGMISALAPEKKPMFTQMGLYTVLASSLANLLSAMIVALLL